MGLGNFFSMGQSKEKNVDIENISYADASARVELLNEEMQTLLAEQEESRRLHDEHACKAVLAGEAIDPSFRQRIDQLESKKSAMVSVLRALRTKLETIRQREIEQATAARRKVAEDQLSKLRQEYADVGGKLVNAIIEARSQFETITAVRAQIQRVLGGEFNDLKGGVPVPLPPVLNLGSKTAMDDWAESACARGFGEKIPDSWSGKRRFMASRRRPISL